MVCAVLNVMVCTIAVFASPRRHPPTNRRPPVPVAATPVRGQTLAERLCADAHRPGYEQAYTETTWEEPYNAGDPWLVDQMRHYYNLPLLPARPAAARVAQMHAISARVEREIGQAGNTCMPNDGPMATAAEIRGLSEGDAFGYGGLGASGIGWGGGAGLERPTAHCTTLVLRFHANFPLSAWCGIRTDHPAETRIVPGSDIALLQTRHASTATPAPSHH